MLPGLMQHQTSDQLACEVLPGLEMDVSTTIIITTIRVVITINMRKGTAHSHTKSPKCFQRVVGVGGTTPSTRSDKARIKK